MGKIYQIDSIIDFIFIIFNYSKFELTVRPSEINNPYFYKHKVHSQ